MLEKNDFIEQKVILVYTYDGEKITFKNDNIVILDNNAKIKYQYSCYKIFLIYVVGGITLTSGIIEKSKKFGFSIILMNTNLKMYQTINFKLEGNTLLRKKQYLCGNTNLIGKYIIINKLENEIGTIKLLRNIKYKSNIETIEKYTQKLINNELSDQEIMGIEGAAAKIYFKIIFDNISWMGRIPRAKIDIVNLLLDTGYTILFNYIESLLNIYGFDVYKGNLHKEFYMRKSLVCDIIEPFRVIIDYKIRKMYNLGQVDINDFKLYKSRYMFNDWRKSSKYIKLFLESINEYKEEIFLFIQSYYRWLMKGKDIDEFPRVKVFK